MMPWNPGARSGWTFHAWLGAKGPITPPMMTETMLWWQ
jgi:hypothetical protein